MSGNGFARGLIIGGMIGASVSVMMNQDMMKSRTKKRIMRGSRSLLKRSGNVLGDVIDLMR